MSRAATSSNTVFEVQQLRSGVWTCVSAAFSQSEAVGEAKSMIEQNENAQTRVIQQVFDHTCDRYVDKIIFRSQSPTDKRKLFETLLEVDISRRATARRNKEARGRAQKKSHRREVWQNFLFYARITFVAVISGGVLVALYALRDIL